MIFTGTAKEGPDIFGGGSGTVRIWTIFPLTFTGTTLPGGNTTILPIWTGLIGDIGIVDFRIIEFEFF